MSASEFCTAGERLFGPNWRGPLAKRLKLSSVTVWRYANGYSHIPYTVELALKFIEAAQPS